jgi:hypothetical protein
MILTVFFLALFAGSLMCLIGTISSLFVPWVHPNVEIKISLYKMEYPLDIGLLKCFSDICKEYYNLKKEENKEKEKEKEEGKNSAKTSEIDSKTSNKINFIPPKIKLPKYNPKSEEKYINQYAHPFETAAKTTLILLFIGDLTMLIVAGSTLYYFIVYSFTRSNRGGLQSIPIATYQKMHIGLIAGLFCLFCGLIAYISLTYKELHGGHYIDGLWIVTYACMGGLICALIAGIMLMEINQHIPLSVRHYSQSMNYLLVGQTDGQVRVVKQVVGQNDENDTDPTSPIPSVGYQI